MAEYPETIKEDLSHVRWICGSVLGGKTTIAKKLASDLDLEVYHIDSHWVEHFNRAEESKHPYMSWVDLSDLSKGRTPSDMRLWSEKDEKAGWIGFYQENFGMIIEDLLSLQKNKPIVAEGVTLPEDILDVSGYGRVICAVASHDFMDVVKDQRAKSPDETVKYAYDFEERWKKIHPEKASSTKRKGFSIHRWIRDQILEKAQKLKIEVIINDGSKSIEELAEMVREHFGL